MVVERKYEPVPMGEDEVDYPEYLDKAPTVKQVHLTQWLVDKVGITFPTKKEEAAFAEGVRLTGSLHKYYQRSPENHERREVESEESTKAAEERAEIADAKKAEREEARAAREAAKEERAAQRAARVSAKAKAEPEANGDAPAPKRRGRPAKAVAEEVEPPKRRGRPARAAAPAAPVSPGEGGTRRPPRRRAAAGAEAKF